MRPLLIWLAVLVMYLQTLATTSGQLVPPPSVAIGLCLSSTLPDYAAVRGAVDYSRYLTNLDSTLTLTTDINITEVDCGTTYASSLLAATTLLNSSASVIGIIGGQTELQSSGIAQAATNVGKPFVSIHSTTPVSKSALLTDAWTIRLSASDYSQAAGFWDLYSAYLNPTLQQNVPTPSQVLVHVIYSSDDPASVAFYQQLAYHGAFLGVSINSTTDLQVAGHSTATATTALTSLMAATPAGSSHTLWVISSTTVLSDLLIAADSLSLFSTYLWVLSEESSLTVGGSALSSTIRVQAQGMIGLVRGKGYVAEDSMFSPYPYTAVNGNTMNWSAYTLSQFGSTYAYPSISAQYAFDSIGTFARALPIVLAVSEGGLGVDELLLLSSLQSVEFVGASGPIAFQPNGDRKSVRFDYVQLYQDEPTPGYKLIGAWSPLTGANLFERDPPPFNRSLGGNGFLGAPSERNDLAYSSVGYSYTWNSIPVQGVPPPIRYGACVVVSHELNSLIVIDGVQSSNSAPYSDVWTYHFPSQSWSFRPISGSKPDGRNYGGCTIKGDYVYLFGGLSANGIKGDMWKFQVSTNQWVQVPLDTNLAGSAQRAQYAVTSMANGMAIWGGRHRPTVNTEMWLWTISTETFSINPITYNSTSWVQPGTPPYSNTLSIKSLLTTDTAGITAETTIGGRDVLIMVGGYLVNTSVVFVYDMATKQLSPLYTSGQNPGFRSLTDGTIVGTKLFINRGWDENAQKNYPTIYTLDLNCPSATCGQWELYLTVGEDHRDSLPSNLYGSQILTFGGWGAEVYNDFQAFDALTPNVKWTLHGNYYSPPGRKFHSTCLIGSQMVVFGGISSDGTARNEMYTLTLDDQLWTNYPAGSDTPFARFGHAAASGRLGMYIFGGTNEIGTIFSELNVFSLATVSWHTYVSSSTSNEGIDWPVGRVFHSMISVEDRFIFVYGGRAANGNYLTDLWQWDITYSQFTRIWDSHPDPTDSSYYSDYSNVTQPTPIDFTRVQPLIQSASVVTPTMIYFIGGLSSGLDPSTFVYGYELPKNDTSLGQWLQLPSMPAPRNQLGAAILSNKIYAYGGLFYEVISSDLYVYDIASSVWSTVDVANSWNRPRPMAGGSMQSYGNSFTIYGGSSAEFGQLHSAAFLLPDVWQYSAGAACTGSNSIINGEPCTECSPGTITSLQWCVPCAAGYYWSNTTGVAVCQPCSPGYAGSLRGTSSFASCLPCANGTYSPTYGASECLPCDPDKYCPIRSHTQLPMTNGSESTQTKYSQTQPIPYDTSVSKKVSDDTSILTWLLVAILCATAIVYLLATFGPKWFYIMAYLDILYQFDHFQYINKPMIRRRTPTGGFCSIIAAVLITYLVAVLCLPYSLDNIIETRSLIPNVATQVMFEGDLTATSTLTGYPGACVVPGTASQCDAGISVSVGDPTNFLNVTHATTTCIDTSTTVDASCQVVWVCPACTVPVKDTVTVKFESDNTFATKIDWSFKSSAGYPEQNSQLFGSVSSGDAVVFRGTTQPTTVSIKLSQTLYTEQYRGFQSTGYHLNFDDRTLGDVTSPITFYASNGVHVAYSLELQLQTMNIQRAQKQTIVQFIGSLLGSTSGIVALIAGIMAAMEMIEEMIFKRIGKRHRGTEAMLTAILQKNHEDHQKEKMSHRHSIEAGRSANFIKPMKSPKVVGEPIIEEEHAGGHPQESSLTRRKVVNDGGNGNSSGVPKAGVSSSSSSAAPAFNATDSSAVSPSVPATDSNQIEMSPIGDVSPPPANGSAAHGQDQGAGVDGSDPSGIRVSFGESHQATI